MPDQTKSSTAKPQRRTSSRHNKGNLMKRATSVSPYSRFARQVSDSRKENSKSRADQSIDGRSGKKKALKTGESTPTPYQSFMSPHPSEQEGSGGDCHSDEECAGDSNASNIDETEQTQFNTPATTVPQRPKPATFAFNTSIKTSKDDEPLTVASHRELTQGGPEPLQSMTAATEEEALANRFFPEGAFPGQAHSALFAAAFHDVATNLYKQFGVPTDPKKAEVFRHCNELVRRHSYSNTTPEAAVMAAMSGADAVKALDMMMEYLIQVSDRRDPAFVIIKAFMMARDRLTTAKSAWAVLNWETAMRRKACMDQDDPALSLGSRESDQLLEVYVFAPERIFRERSEFAAAARRNAAAGQHEAVFPRNAEKHHRSKPIIKTSLTPCRDYNSKDGCKRDPCKFQHVCSHGKCAGKNRAHTLLKCFNNKPREPRETKHVDI
jgi:hypothetical protein